MSSPTKIIDPRQVRYGSLFARVMAHIYTVDWQIESLACWLFDGPLDKDGYGVVSYRVPGLKTPRTRRTHIIVWEEFNGPLPEDRTLDHLDCVGKACCNPEHVECVTRAVNSARRWKPVYGRA